MVALYGCSRPDGDRPYTVDEPYYILGYQTSRNIAAKQSGVNTTRNCFSAYVAGAYGASIVSFYSEGEDLDTYLMLCDKNGDNGYKSKRVFGTPEEESRYMSLGYEISRMDLASDAAFDSEHPAGASLADICQLQFGSFRRYIESGYKKTFNWNNRPEGYVLPLYGKPDFKKSVEPVAVMMQDYTAEDSRMTYSNGGGSVAFGVFQREPTESQEHNMTLTIEFADGEVSEIPFTMKWN